MYHSLEDHGNLSLLLNKKLSAIGLGYYQYALFALCGAGWVADNMWLQATAAILPRVQQEFNIPNSSAGLLITFTLVGMIVGGACWGILSDIIGRKPSFTLTLVIATVFGTCAAFSSSFPILCLLLALMGVGVGGNLPVDGALFLEFIPAEHHGLLTLMSLFWPIGSVISSGVSWAVIPTNSCIDANNCSSELNRGWRFLILILGGITLMMVLGRLVFFRMLESPKFLTAKGRIPEAVLVLQKLASINKKEIDITVEEFEDALLLQKNVEFDGSNDDGLLTDLPTFKSDSLKSRIQKLFSKDMRKTTILVWLIWILVSMGYNMFNGFLPKFLERSGDIVPPTTDQIYFRYMIISFFGIPGSILGWFLVDSKLGRKGTMALSTFGTSAGLFLFTMFTTSQGQLISSSVASFLQNIMWGVIYAYSPEVFETSYRGTAVGIASALGRIFGSLAPIVTGIFLEIDLFLPFYVSSACIFLAGILMILLPIETRSNAAN